MRSPEPVELLAPAKLNLCLYLGPEVEDLHLICSIFQPIDLSDLVTITPSDVDQVICPGIDGDDLTAQTLRLLREAELGLPSIKVEVTKRIPVAAGMGGGSADAAALLRYAREVLGQEAVPELREIASTVGSDVLAQSGLWFPSAAGAESSRSLVTGTGDAVSAAPAGESFAAVLLCSSEGLSTAEVYAEADRLGLGRSGPELEGVAESLRFGSSGLPLFPLEAAVNDLQTAALSLRPELERGIAALRGAGAVNAMVTGSGPTVYGVFADRAQAERAAEEVSAGEFGQVLVAEPLATQLTAEAGQ